jgi:hypothetical protein
MRIAILQFAPQVGDVNNNLNRADAVLSKANPKDLDLLVLPEMAFSGEQAPCYEATPNFIQRRNSPPPLPRPQKQLSNGRRKPAVLLDFLQLVYADSDTLQIKRLLLLKLRLVRINRCQIR